MVSLRLLGAACSNPDGINDAEFSAFYTNVKIGPVDCASKAYSMQRRPEVGCSTP